eukprot:CAMPEP_0183505906 /NCGR_PEP_ID=MMETSP0371-20130417/7010_1 /TAXON_ID=268820 /ORGANISM="Peridinium aciculiferum, Strain PAER-2" /LENGTH=271 /DNA_ID=CAMNT_0025701709 /DNA_START=54 /DNA_END=867 /DNA_ORIENTATION=+
MDHDSLVWKVKELQKTDPLCKEQWAKYTVTEGGGTKDPAKHDVSFLHRFLEIRGSIEVTGAYASCSLADFFREACKLSPTFKQAWKVYRQGMGESPSDDPSRHSRDALTNALEFMAQAGLTMMTIGGMTTPEEAWQPGAKRLKSDTSGLDPAKLTLVNKVKEFQKSGDEQKQAWWSFAQMHGLSKDPARFEDLQLQEFLAMQGMLEGKDPRPYVPCLARPHLHERAGAPAIVGPAAGGCAASIRLGRGRPAPSASARVRWLVPASSTLQVV